MHPQYGPGSLNVYQHKYTPVTGTSRLSTVDPKQCVLQVTKVFNVISAEATWRTLFFLYKDSLLCKEFM